MAPSHFTKSHKLTSSLTDPFFFSVFEQVIDPMPVNSASSGNYQDLEIGQGQACNIWAISALEHISLF